MQILQSAVSFFHLQDFLTIFGIAHKYHFNLRFQYSCFDIFVIPFAEPQGVYVALILRLDLSYPADLSLTNILLVEDKDIEYE